MSYAYGVLYCKADLNNIFKWSVTYGILKSVFVILIISVIAWFWLQNVYNEKNYGINTLNIGTKSVW